MDVPPPPPIAKPASRSPRTAAASEPQKANKLPENTNDTGGNLLDRAASDAKPILIETGLASWYGAPYHNRRSSDGKIYDMNAMTAAHRTLPLGSVVRVTNLKTGNSAVVRITDRGPFIKGRILDLSLAAAKETDVWRAGITRVRVDVLQTPASLATGGRWAVQIGAFKEEDGAAALVSQLTRRYHTAKISSFSSPVGDWWVRVRVQGDDRNRAEKVVSETTPLEGTSFLVRLD
ncbi:MAG: septal ring lytic transglycosylase RlpA family protein [Acidobacteriota bacterium]|nr:septal ring lytic transglycosylase RlpA family protein [Acidobacteriota bacterium]